MSQIESAVAALHAAADALEAVPAALRIPSPRPGLWLGAPPPNLTPALLRLEADHIARTLADVLDADRPVDQDLTDADIVTELHRCEDCGDTRSPDDHRCPNEDCPSHLEDEGGLVNLGGPVINVFLDVGAPDANPHWALRLAAGSLAAEILEGV